MELSRLLVWWQILAAIYTAQRRQVAAGAKERCSPCRWARTSVSGGSILSRAAVTAPGHRVHSLSAQTVVSTALLREAGLMGPAMGPFSKLQPRERSRLSIILGALMARGL